MRKSKDFGTYLNECRNEKMTIQQLADIYGCSKVYMWDVLKGNVNPPQNFEKVERIINELQLNNKERCNLYDKTALPNDIPIDIKEIILKNPELKNKIREMKIKGDL